MIVAKYMDVVDSITMEPVPRDGKTMGEIVMRGNNVMLGYIKTPKPQRNPSGAAGSTAAILQ